MRCVVQGLTASIFLFATAVVASTPAELSVAGALAGRNLFRSESTSYQTEFNDQWIRMVRVSRSDQNIFSDPAAESIWIEAQLYAREAVAALARIAQIDNRKPSDWQMVVDVLKLASDDKDASKRSDDAGWEIVERIFLEASKGSLETDFRNAELKFNAKLADLMQTVNSGYASRGIGITHLPSWQGAYNSDLLILQNQTGRDLRAPAFFVTFTGKDGSRLTHVHHASVWSSNQALYFNYPFYESNYASRQTVMHPVRVEVNAFSPDGYVRDAKVWSEDDYDSTIRRYIQDLKFSTTFLGEYVEDGSNTQFFPGVKFTATGLRRLPVKRIYVRLTRRGEFKEAYWEWNKYLASGEEVVLRARTFAQFGKDDPPEQKQVILEFADSSTQAVVTW